MKRPIGSPRKMTHPDRRTAIDADMEDVDDQEAEEEEEEEEEMEAVSRSPRRRSERRAGRTTQAALLREVGVGLRVMSHAFGVAVMVSNQVRSVSSSSSSSFAAGVSDAGEWQEPLHPTVVKATDARPAREHPREEDTRKPTPVLRSLSSPTQWFSMRPSSSSSSFASTTTTPLGFTWASIPHVRLRLYRDRFLCQTTTPTRTTTAHSSAYPGTTPPTIPRPSSSSSSSTRTLLTITKGVIVRKSVEEDAEKEIQNDPIEHPLRTSSSRGVAAGVLPRPTDSRWVEVYQSSYMAKGTRIPFQITANGVEDVNIESYVGVS